MESSEGKIEDLVAHRLLERAEVSVKHRGQRAKDKLKNEQEPAIGTPLPAHEAIATIEPDFVKIEKNLASFGFFTPSSKRIKNAKAKTITFTRWIDGKRIEAKVTIAPAALYGLPITG